MTTTPMPLPQPQVPVSLVPVPPARADIPSATSASERQAPPYRSLRALAAWLLASLSSILVREVFAAAAYTALALSLDALAVGAVGAGANAAAAAARVAAIDIAGPLYITTGVLFLVWFRRAYRNLDALSSRARRFSAG